MKVPLVMPTFAVGHCTMIPCSRNHDAKKQLQKLRTKRLFWQRSDESRADEILIRSTAIAQKISHATNLSAAEASVKAMRSLKDKELTVKSIQEYHA